MNEQQQQEAREAFEMNCPTPITRPPGGEYLNDRTCHGWQAYLAATERMQAMVDEVTRERDQYRDTLVARHGGEPLALLSELDEARQRIAALTRELAEARKDAERWDVVESLMICYVETRLVQEEDGRWGIHGEDGIECADRTWYGGTPGEVIDAAIQSTKGPT